MAPSYGKLSTKCTQGQVPKRNRETSFQNVQAQNSVNHEKCSEYNNEDYVDEIMISNESDLQIKVEEEANTCATFGVGNTDGAYLINDQMNDNQFYSENVTFVCDVCGQAFSEMSTLYEHKHTIHAGEKSYICDVCGMGFDNKDDSDRHKQVHIGEKHYECNIHRRGLLHNLVDKTLIRLENGLRIKIEEEERATDACRSEFSKNSNRNRNKEDCTGCQNEHLKIHTRMHPVKRTYICDECGKHFDRKSNLTAHKQTHNGKKPCDICPQVFSQNVDVYKHKRIHNGGNTFVCDICRQGFSQSSHLVRHKQIHTGEKTYICDTCGKGFSQNSDLVRHRRIHTGEKPHICDVCGKRFSRIDKLGTHKRVHTGERPYTCDV